MNQFKFLKNKNNFLGIKNSNEAASKVYVVPYGLEKTVSYGKGTSLGPEKILKASQQIELYDIELGIEPSAILSPKTLEVKEIPSSHVSALIKLQNIVKLIVSCKKFPIVIGGEHSITPACIKPLLEKNKSLTIVQFDAHADLRDKYQGKKNSHACSMRRCLDNENLNLISIGVRSISNEEYIFYKNNKKRIEIFWAKDAPNWDLKKLKKLLKNKNVYISFDVDALDPSLMPATGTPEPNGLCWDHAINLIKLICKNSKVLGADINEFSPIKSNVSCDFIVAKLVYKIMSYSLLKNIL